MTARLCRDARGRVIGCVIDHGAGGDGSRWSARAGFFDSQWHPFATLAAAEDYLRTAGLPGVPWPPPRGEADARQ